MAVRLDDVDRQIIALLVKDGRTPCATVARAVGEISARTARYRIARLMRNGVIQVSAIVTSGPGFKVIADVFLEVSPGRLHELAERFAALANVSYVAGSIGQGDLSIQVYARNEAELLRFVEEVVGVMPGVMRTRTALVPWKLKDVYQSRPRPRRAAGRLKRLPAGDGARRLALQADSRRGHRGR